MVSVHPQSPAGPANPVFAVACWVLGVMAFVELLVAAMALATRFEESKQARVVERQIVKPIVVRLPAAADHPALATTQTTTPGAPAAAPPAEVVMPEPTPLTAPMIAEPRTERLVKEARVARVAGDMGLAIVKLEEALAQSPGDPTVLYELGLVHEQMGVMDRAADYYEKVFQLGVSEAGSLYEIAAAKLRDGFAQPTDMLGKLSLGRVRIFNDPNHESGQRVILTIPVQKSPASDVNVADIAVSVTFFNKTARGEIIQLDDKSWVTERWLTLPFDWDGGEENLRMTYVIPRQDNPTEHLFGSRTYYGQVVSLSYQEEVLDVQAWPRDLAARIPKSPAAGPADSMLPEFQDQLPPDFDPEVPLLPALPSN